MYLTITPTTALLTSILLSISYVISLYLASPSIHADRDDPAVIKRRATATTIICLLAPLTIYHHLTPTLPPHFNTTTTASHITLTLPQYLNLTTHSAIPAACLAITLIHTLYLGTFYVHCLNALHLTTQTHNTLTQYITYNIRNTIYPAQTTQKWITARNLLFAPLTEEWIYRLVICTLLLATHHYTIAQATVLSPILFALSHLHHLVMHVKARKMPLKFALFTVTFQLLYTTLFGLFAAFIFIHTGHIVSAIIVHIACNCYGLPDLSFMNRGNVYLRHLHDQRNTILAVYAVGIVTFAYGVYTLGHSSYFDSVYVKMAAR